MKTVKVFGVGKWNNIEFSKEKVKELLENTKDKVKAIFVHSSKWIKEGKDPIEIGEFSNLRLQDNDVVAELELNEKGKEYYNDGIIKGISAEITDKFDRIAGLPIGVKQAVIGAEFEEEQIIEFEIIEGGKENTMDISKLSLEEKLDLVKQIGSSITDDQKRSFRAVAWEFADVSKEIVEAIENNLEFEIKPKKQPKTEEQIRAEVKLELEFESKKEREVKEKNDLVNGAIKELKEEMKLIPAQEKEFEAILNSCDHSEKLDTLEFEEDGKTAIKKTQLERVIEFSKNSFKTYEKLLEENEYEEQEKSQIEEFNRDIKGL